MALINFHLENMLMLFENVFFLLLLSCVLLSCPCVKLTPENSNSSRFTPDYDVIAGMM